MGDRSTLLALIFTIFLQASAGIWWASKLQTRQEMHTEWIAGHQAQQEDYPVVKNRVMHLEESMGKLIFKMDKYLDELRATKGVSNGTNR